MIKDFAELLSQRIARRVDGIAPAHATRMGAAIRHAVRKLERVEAQTRLLFLVSDGRPYDRDYGRDANDQEYAVRDTHQALREAVRRKVRPFCLTVDKDGADYMRAMCETRPMRWSRASKSYPSVYLRRIPEDDRVNRLLFRKDCVYHFLQALSDLFIVRQCLHHGDLARETRRDPFAHQGPRVDEETRADSLL